MTQAQGTGLSAAVIGDLDVTRRTCAALAAGGYDVHHLLRPTDSELRAALTTGFDAVAILVRGDVIALRYALLVEHLAPNVRLIVTMFDRAVARQLVHAVPNCVVTSPADIAVPSILGALLGGRVLAVDVTDSGTRVISRRPHGEQVQRWRRRRFLLRSLFRGVVKQVRPHDTTTRILVVGLYGMLLVLGADWFMTARWLHESAADSLYAATRVIATVGPGGAVGDAPGWYLVFSSVSMLLTIGLTALFTAGVVNRLRSARSVGLVGSRTLPTRDHVVVVGLGQVGLRLCTQLRQLGIPVVAVERDPSAANLRLAKLAKVPVLVAPGNDFAVLRKLSLSRARALAAMGSDDLDNVEIAIAALAVRPDLRIVLRAGEDGVIAETRSLFSIGEVRDVSALTTLAVMLSVTGQRWEVVFTRDHDLVAFPQVSEPGEVAPRVLQSRCTCQIDALPTAHEWRVWPAPASTRSPSL